MMNEGDEMGDMRDTVKRLRELLSNNSVPHIQADVKNELELDFQSPLEMLACTFELLINTSLLKYAESGNENYATFMTYIQMQIDSIAMVVNDFTLREAGLDPKAEFEKAYGKKEQDLPDIIKDGLEGLDLDLN